ncbi:O-antigen polysaccharide polymerase Wzy [Citrobacter braakii]|nr:O-antigen polysaccharide polymerase Wzy [Citrobacter braakii]
MMIFLSFLLCCLGMVFIFKFAPPSINEINNITFNIYLYYFILSIVGAFIITWSDDFFDIPSYYINSEIKEYALLVISTNFTIYCLCLLFFLTLFNNANGLIYKHFKEKKFTFSKNEKKITIFFDCLLVLCICGLVYFLFINKSVPLALLIHGKDFSEVYEARIEAFNSSAYIFFVKKFLYETSIIVALYFFVHESKLKKYIACFICLLFCFIQTEKAPIIYLILALFFVSMLKNNKKIGLFKLAFLLTFVMILLVALYSILYQQSNAIDSLINVVNRIFIQQISGVFLSIQYFGEYKPFDLGYNIFPRIYSGIFGIDQSKIIAEQLAEYYLTDLYNAGVVKNINGLYVMDAWAAGGWIGTILVTILLAGYGAFTYIFFLRKRKEPTVLAFYGYFSVYNFSFITSAGVSIFSPFAILFLFIFVILYKISSR